jgi:hypothetical protein
MALLYLKAYGSGYRGCVIQAEGYLFFQCSPKRGLKPLKWYPKTEFEDLSHFMAMMQKFIAPPAFLSPPLAVPVLTMEALDRANAQIKAEKNKR